MTVNPIGGGQAGMPMLAPHNRFELEGPTLQAPDVGELDGAAPGRLGFSDIFAQAVGQAAELGHTADDKSAAFARGVHDDLHGTMIATKEAEISVKLVGTIRTKLLESFQELWRINV
jgi:flagellar hook-basal body complex protein FliE